MRLRHKHLPVPVGGPPSAVAGRRAVTLATTMALTSALLTACADSDAAGSDATDTVTVGVAGNVFDVPLRVADARGYFRKHGLKVNFVTVTATTGTSSLESGSLQFLNSSPTGFLGALARGLPETAVGVDGLGNPLGLVVSKEFARRHGLTAKSPSGDVARALAGSTGGFSSANTRAESEMFLKDGNVGTDEVTWVSLPNPGVDKAALGAGRIDWFLTSEPLPLQIQESGDGVVVANSHTVNEWGSSYAGYGQIVVTRKSYTRQHAAEVRKFMAAVREGTSYLYEHVNEPSVVSVAKTALPGVPDSVVQAGIKEVEWPWFADMEPGVWKKTLDFVSELGVLPEGAELTPEDWSNEYLR
ncbi:ABC transporter substrate-binding protein [Streptomyces sp. NPDC086182]|uniref:ABC transporter substrate-binding protein n=1 Tax=Streptomyces sp. NPDC086182 TaxID=3155058 RepID=UPI003426C7AE